MMVHIYNVSYYYECQRAEEIEWEKDRVYAANTLMVVVDVLQRVSTAIGEAGRKGVSVNVVYEVADRKQGTTYLEVTKIWDYILWELPRLNDVPSCNATYV